MVENPNRKNKRIEVGGTVLSEDAFWIAIMETID